MANKLDFPHVETLKVQKAEATVSSCALKRGIYKFFYKYLAVPTAYPNDASASGKLQQHAAETRNYLCVHL